MRPFRKFSIPVGLLLFSLFAALGGRIFNLRPAVALAAADLPVYTDTLASGWEDWSWDTTLNWNNSTPVHAGTASISAAYTAAWGGVYLGRSNALPASDYTALRFWINGGSVGNRTIAVRIIDGAGGNWDNHFDVTPAANAWTQVSVPLTAVGNPATIAGLVWQDGSGGVQPAFYLDDVVLVGNGAPTPTPTITRTPTVTRTPGTVTPTTPVPTGAYPPILVNETAVIDGYASNQFTWYDSQGLPRSAALVKNDRQDPSGHQGGFLRQFTYRMGSTTRVVDGSSTTHPGFGYTVNHYGSTAALSYNFAGTYDAVLRGRHHAIHQFTWRVQMGGPVDVTVQWFFATGRDHPVWAVTFDSSPSGPDVVNADTRAPYGDLQWDGGLDSDVEAVGWGDHYKFRSLGSPITLNNAWDYSQPNTVPYVVEYAGQPDAEMGLVQSQSYLQHDAGGYWFYDQWGNTDADGPMPEDWNWPYQLNQYELPWGSSSKRLAWGANYGAVGQTHYAAYGEPGPGGSLTGYPYQSYSVFVVLDRHSLTPVARQVTEIENVQATTLTASVGSVVTSGPAGLGRADTISYSPAGYNPIYSTWEVRADGSGEAVFNLNVASGALADPVLVVHDYQALAAPATILVNGVPRTADVDYFASLDADNHVLWVTLKGSFSGNTQIAVSGSIFTPSAWVYLPAVWRMAGNTASTPTPTPTRTATATATATATQSTPSANLPYVGVSLAGADFGEDALPGVYGVNYIYPNAGEVDYFAGKGMTIFRLPFRWERLQQSQFAAFDADEQQRMDSVVNYATGQGVYVLLDPHNYARYYGNLIGESTVPVTAFTDFWSRLADHYRQNDHVIFGLMNEPNTMSTELWVSDANAAIQAIRATGATNLILVPGNAWSGAHSWGQNWYGTSNAVAMLNISDPGNNYAFEVHQYLDNDSSGTSDTCVSNTIGSERMAVFTTWLRQNNKRGFLGEFAGGVSTTCLEALDDVLTYLDQNSDVYLGWTYWAAGPWWGDSPMAIEPINGIDRPQMAPLSSHLPGGNFAVRYPAGQMASPLTLSVVHSMGSILARGSGQNPNVFMKVGDSITVNDNFLACFTNALPWGITPEEYRNVGERVELLQALDYFSTTLGAATPFDRVSLAAQVGVGASWPLEGDPAPLDQEIAAIHPMFAVIMYGTNDLGWGGSSDPSTDQYKFLYYPQNMLELVDQTIQRGVIPILMTIPPRLDDPRYELLAPSYNAIVRGIAEARQIPLIDYYHETLPLPNHGIGEDGVHPNLYAASGGWPSLACNLTAPGLQYGFNIRNLVTLVTLERLRRVFADGRPYLDPALAGQALALSGTGSAALPYEVTQLPFTDVRDIRLSSHQDLDVYACSGTPTRPGPENVYRLVVQTATPLRAFVAGRQDNQIGFRLSVLAGTAQGTNCLRSQDVVLSGTFQPGTYYFSVDTATVGAAAGPGEYFFGVVPCEAGDVACTASIP